MKVVTWNLFHGRSQPPAGRSLLPEFTDALRGWDWDVACLQEVPPWWPRPLAQACRASMRMALTSRNELLLLRRLLAERWPDLMKSSGGGCNAILVRGERILEHRREELTRDPLRRVMHAVRLDSGRWVANIHASKQEPRARSLADIARAAAALERWTAGGAAAWGGDFNIRDPSPPGWSRAASHRVDHVLARGAQAAHAGVLDAGVLSDHRPLTVDLAF
jgi:endonuclease/exonuclease/phosphatase family metal-dependent hydrolase